MGEDEPKSRSPNEDRYVSPEFLVLLAENAEGLRERVEDILEEMRQDENISEMTDKLYQQKSYLTGNLTEVSRRLKVLADQISSTIKFSATIGLYFALSRDSTVLCVTKTEHSNSSVSSSSDPGSESTLSTNNADTRKDKETKTTEIFLQKCVNSGDQGNEKENEVSDLKHALSVANLKNEKLGIELKALRKKVAVSDVVIKDLKQQRANQESREGQMQKEIRSITPLLQSASKQAHSHEDKIQELAGQLSLVKAQITERDNQITELSNKNKQYTSDISQLKTTHKNKENNWRTSIGKVRKELEKKHESIDNLTEKLVNAEAEKSAQEKLVQELKTHLSSLQADHVGSLVSFDIAQTVANELTERVLELEKEVDRQREVISVRDEQKKEAIRQITSVLEHYKSTY